jgi:hypothetical protein
MNPTDANQSARRAGPAWRSLFFNRSLTEIIAVLLVVNLAGCALSADTSKTPRAPIEQLLLTQSFERSLTDAVPPVRSGQSIAVEAIGPTEDTAFAVALVERWLIQEGYSIPKNGEEDLIAKVILDAFGTLQDLSFVGIPPIGAGLLPLSLPELALYKAARQRGLTRLSIDFIDKKTGRFVSSSPLYEGDAYHNQYTFFFVFSLRRTDLIPPPP